MGEGQSCSQGRTTEKATVALFAESLIDDSFESGILAYQVQKFNRATAGYLKKRQRAKGAFLCIISSARLIASRKDMI
jgi:hypothetical protein